MFSIAYFKSFEEAQEGKLDFTKEIGKFIEEFNWEILPNSHVKKIMMVSELVKYLLSE